ncbi:MAG: DNA-methyltransferase [Candidatus Heimdallarchaeaceae archaeon]
MTKKKDKGYSKNRYKRIVLPLSHPLSEDEHKSIMDLKKKFPVDDFFIELSDKVLYINLNSVNLKLLKEEINNLVGKYQLKASNILYSVIEQIEAIKSYGIKSGKRIYVGYAEERKVKGRKKKEQKRGMYFYARNNSFEKVENELPEEFLNKIICGDSEEILKKFPKNSIDLIFTSPPYNFGLNYHEHEDSMDWNKYFNKLFAIFNECIRVLKYGGRIIVNVQPLFSDYIPIHHIISNFFMQKKLIWKGEILWEKHNYNCKYTAWGSWKSPSNPYLKYTWEFLEIFAKGDLKHEGCKEFADITSDEFKKWVYAKWDIPPEISMKKWGHPAMFPEELAKRVIKLFSFQNDIILDPFNGVGTTTKVAKKLNRRYVGIDVSEEYCKKAKKRLEE